MGLLVSIAGLAVLAFAAGAQAKGPSAARITGPAIHTLTISGNGELGAGSRLGRLTEEAGFFPAVFGQTPDPMLRTRPQGSLGPRYTLIWTVPGLEGVSRLRQSLYPYAKPLPLTYMKPGQTYWGNRHTYGGWFQAGRSLRQLLVSAGLPARPPGPAQT
jgi:hypothetical protein